MSVEYTYEIVRVDQPARCMEIVYQSPGRQPLHISARLPFTGETLESIVSMYAPVAYWIEQDKSVQAVELGVSGTLKYDTPLPPLPGALIYARRNYELQQSDWTQLTDVPLSAEQKAQWVNYRQLLRDVPQQPGFPDTVIWPTAPNVLAPIPTSTL
jgi:hypothetical protein